MSEAYPALELLKLHHTFTHASLFINCTALQQFPFSVRDSVA